jgi:hypothetical protein
VRVSEERWVRNGESEKGEWSMCVVCMNSREHMKRKGKKAGAGRNRRKTKKKSPFVSVTSEKKRGLFSFSLSLSLLGHCGSCNQKKTETKEGGKN